MARKRPIPFPCAQRRQQLKQNASRRGGGGGGGEDEEMESCSPTTQSANPALAGLPSKWDQPALSCCPAPRSHNHHCRSGGLEYATRSLILLSRCSPIDSSVAAAAAAAAATAAESSQVKSSQVKSTRLLLLLLLVSNVFG